eukprot:29282-Pelagococcus_subviridis.AAC.1
MYRAAGVHTGCCLSVVGNTSAKSARRRIVRAGGQPVSSSRSAARRRADIFSNRARAAVAAKNGTDAATAATFAARISRYTAGRGDSPARTSNRCRSNPKNVCVFFRLSSLSVG